MDNNKNLFPFAFLSGNILKFIAAVAMTIDHIGVVIFPRLTILRIIGRIAFPIFAFMIAEGCRYTKNKLKYFLCVFGTATVCQIAYTLYSQSLYMSILVTFSISILLIFALQYMKKTLSSSKSEYGEKVLSIAVFFLGVAAAFVLNCFVKIDYGFIGCMLPVFASIFESEKELLGFLRKLGVNFMRVLTFGIGLLLLVLYQGGIASYALLALVLLALYSGKRGKLKMKYFFYVFYPAHLLIINGISMLI